MQHGVTSLYEESGQGVAAGTAKGRALQAHEMTGEYTAPAPVENRPNLKEAGAA